MKKKKKLADVGTVLRKISDQETLKSWTGYMAENEPWKSEGTSAEALLTRYGVADSQWQFFSAADSRAAKVRDFAHEHGFVAFSMNPPKLEWLPADAAPGAVVDALATKMRHKGLGKYLLNAAERVISEKHQIIYALVSEKNTGAIRFYKGAGYEEIARHGSSIVFSKRLAT